MDTKHERAYMSPQLQELNLAHEGLLCSSTQTQEIEEFYRESDVWEW